MNPPDDEWAAQHLFDRIAALEAALANAKDTIKAFEEWDSANDECYSKSHVGLEAALAEAKRDRDSFGEQAAEAKGMWRRFDEALAERTREVEAWMETAAQAYRNADYYRGLVVEIGRLFGVAARTADDGGISEDVLCAKVPELVKQERTEDRAAIRALASALDDLLYQTCGYKYEHSWEQVAANVISEHAPAIQRATNEPHGA